MNDVHRSDNVRVVKTSLFVPYASGTHHYLIAKALVTFYNHERQQIIGVLVDTDVNWNFELSEDQLNYFGHLKASNNFIIRDMQADALNYASVKSITYPDSFTHEVSNEYSSRWSGPMIYDSITEYTEAMEKNGRLHRVTVRMTVGYTLVNGTPSIYALVLKII